MAIADIESPPITFESKDMEVGKLKIRAQYQRPLDEARVRRMVADWDSALSGTVEVSFAEGSYWVVDGQHRLAAMRAKGVRVCHTSIHYGLTIEDEARLFGKLNSQRRAVMPRDLYRAELVEGSERSGQIEAILRTYGLHVELSGGHQDRGISAVQYLWELHAAGVLDSTLRIITGAWNDGEGTPAHGALQGRVIGGIGRFIATNQHQDKWDLNRLQVALSRHRPDELIREARTFSSLTVGTRATLYRWFNYNLQHKLPEVK